MTERLTMTELITRLRFALACLQGRPVARHITAEGGIATRIEAKPLIENITTITPRNYVTDWIFTPDGIKSVSPDARPISTPR